MSFRRALRPFRRTMSGEKIYEGVFAVHKPQGVSSADVVRHLQHHFNPSELFRPWLADERARRERESTYQRKRRRTQRLDVKIGHGGTLDPLATGVLVAGVGKGTKHLNEFLACTKQYETVVLFGAETDTYDRLGKVVRKGPYEHITREMVEKALEQFRGKIMQRPPIFSALRVQGKKLYEYAREGKEPPIEIKSRPVEVHDLRVVEWFEPGTHEWKWPTVEAEGDEKVVAEKLLEKEDKLPVVERDEEKVEADEGSAKRPAEDDAKELDAEAEAPAKKQKVADGEAAPVPQAEQAEAVPETAKEASETAEKEKETEAQPQPQPAAVKITMTVSSGFYVRSLAHDLGKAVGSCGLMSSLVRSRQAQFELDPEKVLEYKDLEAGEEVWGPKVQRFLEDWEEKRLARSPPRS